MVLPNEAMTHCALGNVEGLARWRAGGGQRAARNKGTPIDAFHGVSSTRVSGERGSIAWSSFERNRRRRGRARASNGFVRIKHTGDVHGRTIDGCTLASIAAVFCRVRILEALIGYGVDVDAHDGDGATAARKQAAVTSRRQTAAARRPPSNITSRRRPPRTIAQAGRP